MDDLTRLILVEDDPAIAALTADFLSGHGFATSCVTDGRALDRALRAALPSLVLLDIMLPGAEDGLAICRRLRADPATAGLPIIMLTAMGTDTDRIVGLEIGADDYISKPFNPRELLARIRAVLRREGRGARPAARLAFGPWLIDMGSRTLTGQDSMRVALTGGEFALLAVLCQHARRVLSRERLHELLHGPATGPVDRSIDIQVSRLRRKLEDDPANPALIKTVRGGGYMFAARVVSLDGEG